MKKVILLTILLLSLLSACVPATTSSTVLGASPSNPIVTTMGMSGEIISPGSTWYFVSEYNPEAFDFGLAGRNRAFSNSSERPVAGKKLKSTINIGFSIKDVEAPEGWNVTLERVYLEREIEDVSYNSYSFLDGLNFVFAVSVPADEVKGVETIIVTIEHGATSQKVPLMVLLDSNQPQITPECEGCTQS
jgi:hypothetical protein